MEMKSFTIIGNIFYSNYFQIFQILKPYLVVENPLSMLTNVLFKVKNLYDNNLIYLPKLQQFITKQESFFETRCVIFSSKT